MNRKDCVGATRASAVSVMACLVVLCVPAVSIAADSSGSTAGAPDRASALLVDGAGYGQPQGEPRVRALQRSLLAIGQRPGPVDGLYGPLTEAAVERLQRDSGLAVDGIVGPQTRRALNAKTPQLARGAGYGQLGGSPQVRAIQRRLRALGHRPGPVDGLYGPRTQAAMERFQRAAGQPASGVLSRVTAVALARAGGDQPARRASDTGRANQPRRRDRAEASVPHDQPGRADGSTSAGVQEQSRTRTPAAADDRTEGTDGAESTPPLLLALAGLALAAIGVVLSRWLKGTRGRPEASRSTGGAVGPEPMPKGCRKGPKPNAGATAPSSPEPGRRRNGAAALGYVSLREQEAVDGRELGGQMAAIDAACRQRGLALKDVIRDLGQVDGTGPERPGMQYALRRLAAGEASCLVVAELGRLGRSAREVGYIVLWLRRREARLVSVNEGLDTGTTSGSEVCDKLVSLGAFDGQRRPSARTVHSDPLHEPRPTKRASGSGRPAIDDVPALKERIRVMRASGMTLQAIADRMNAENVPTLRGGIKWRPSAVQSATGYRRPRPDASEPGNRGERDGNGSSGEWRGRSRRPTSSRSGGGTR
jgi:peptidoglycan hydrolase-like protein with peptidoglycan-binding domain